MFTILDRDSIPVTLTRTTWFQKLLDPVKGHPEVKPYFPGIKQTIRDPDFIYQSVRDARSKLLYRADLTSGKFFHCYILVVVKYVQEPFALHGYVSTVMLTDHLKKTGGLLWIR